MDKNITFTHHRFRMSQVRALGPVFPTTCGTCKQFNKLKTRTCRFRKQIYHLYDLNKDLSWVGLMTANGRSNDRKLPL